VFVLHKDTSWQTDYAHLEIEASRQHMAFSRSRHAMDSACAVGG